MKLTKLLKEFKSQAFFNGNMKIGQVYSNPYARSFVNEEGDEVERESGLNLEQKQAFLEAVKSYKQYGESIYRQHADLKEVYGTIRELVEVAQHMTIDETQDWFDGVTVSRHMKRMNESFKVFEKTLKEVTTLQQRLESAYDEIGEVLGKYYEINEKLDPVGQEDGDIDNDGDEDASDEYLLNRRKTVAKAIANESVNEDTKKRFDVDFYKGDGDRQTSHEEIIRGDKFSDVVSQATKVAKSKGMNYVEFYYKDSFIGSIDKRNNYTFKKGRDSQKSPLSVNEENARLNKKVKSYLDDYLRDEKKNSPTHQHAIMLIMKGALVDANFHSEAKQLDKYFPKAKQSELVGTAMEDLIEDKGIQISKWAKWDGYDIIDAFAFYTNMTIGGGFGNKLKSLKESVNESTKLTDILKRK